MIRNTTPVNLKRRIAVIRPAPVHAARLGSINDGYPASPGSGYSTISIQEPDPSQNFMSVILMRQDHARLTTPGTLFYTPANRTAPPNVAPWNSWKQPNCAAAAEPAAPAIAAPPKTSNLWLIAGILGSVASSLYILNNLNEGGRR